MNHRYHILGCLLALMGLMASLSGCTDELEGVFKPGRPSDVICFTASLSDSRARSVSRGSSGHLAIEQEEWLVGVEEKQGASRGTPVTLLSGSAGVIGYVYDNWSDTTQPWPALYNKQFDFEGDELTAASNDVRWSTIAQATENTNVKFYLYAPFGMSGATLSGETTGGVPTMTCRVNDDVTNQHDFIVASWQGSKGTNYGENIEPQTIPLVFEHALTAVKFKVGFACTVKELRIEGIYNSGTYTFGKGWVVTSSGDNVKSNYSFTFGTDGAGTSLSANEALTDGDKTLMMIPQTLPTGAKVTLTYINKDRVEKTITSSLEGKEWEEGKMITYTIHESNAPTTVYFDLAAGDVTIGSTYSGKVYVDGEAMEVTGTHESRNQYYVYQSSTNELFPMFGPVHTGYANETDFSNKANCRIPDYNPVKYQNQLWRDYITNNTVVEDVIEVWDDGSFIREDGSSAPDEEHVGVAVVREAGRTHTRNYIKVLGGNTKYNLTIDDIYSVIQEPVNSDQQFRKRSKGGIAYIPSGKTHLKVNFVGDNRMGCLHINNTLSDTITLQGTGTLTVADADFLTVKEVGDYNTDFGDTKGYISNFWNSAIGNNTDDSAGEKVYNLYISSGTIFAGVTKTEDCTAIGGGGNGFGQVYITGGTVTAVATTAGTAIGGGMGHSGAGGSGEVHISGGNIYAYNFENRWHIPSSAIGGGSSYSSYGQGGTVNIHGGYVYAYSALGTAIGGGSSSTLGGGNANVSISGGQVIAKSGSGAGIGGGSSRTNGGETESIYNGGTATINISGDPIIRTGSIGGGITKDPRGKIGSAIINISGGDIQAQFVMAAGAVTMPAFTMSDGTIRNSYADDKEYVHIQEKGGAVYLEDGTFTMTGGTIKNCSAVQGGAVYIDSSKGNSTFTMSGGEIHSCFATGDNETQGHGGAVYLNGGQVMMEGGIIRNNYSVNGDGGAVYISNGNFFMQDGLPEISGNSAQKGNGGGVFVSSAGSEVQVNLLRGLITGNSANNNGGGVCVDMGTTSHAASVIVGEAGAENNTTPDISGNTAMLSGGGLYVRGLKANITIDGGNIKGNQVSAYVKNENVANEGGEVTLNAEHVTDFVTVTFDGNGGTIAGAETYEQKVVINTNSKLTENQFINGGKNFVRWNNRPDNLGDISYDNGAKINISKDITLYAIWADQ